MPFDPAHNWPLVKIGDIARQVTRREEVKPSRRYRMLGLRLYANGPFVREELDGSEIGASCVNRVCKGDFIYTRLFASKGTFAIAGDEHDGCYVSNEFPTFRLNPERVDSEYLLLVFSRPRMWKRIEAFCSGTTTGSRFRLKEHDFLNLNIHLPSLEEQQAIATVLRSVDETIEKTETLIGHIEELKRRLLNHFFSKGLQELKRSHTRSTSSAWTIEKLGNVAKIGNGLTPSRKQQEYWEGGNIPWMSSGKVNEIEITSPTAYITQKAVAECSIKLLPKGTILVAMIGQGKTRGIVARLGIDACINQNVAYVIPNDRIDFMFLFYYLQHQYAHLRSSGRGSNQDAINCAILRSYPVPLPSMNEQKTIARIGESFERRIAAERAYLAQLQEVKRGLAQALLSGQVRVPERVNG